MDSFLLWLFIPRLISVPMVIGNKELRMHTKCNVLVFTNWFLQPQLSKGPGRSAGTSAAT